ncbi:DUF5666 domain-containing protein [Jongsikchunia kroppenstedtii]|uniref:DUF5666 domain-containing protein n=1 Tax=Jongsikchunia kroppenstedtii TaxID=1121721 RepID=UPI00036CE79B|nr:DUF5666 domain-containing protein [Jongsikchunia kroppenstedtii]
MSRPEDPANHDDPRANSGEPQPHTQPYSTDPYATAPHYESQPAATPPPGGSISRHRTAILTGLIGLIVGGVIGGLIGWAATDDTSSQSSSASPTSHTSARHVPAQRAGHGVVGSITAINGNSWTVQARQGSTVTVGITSDTAFGTTKKPEQESDFAVGDKVAVVGHRSGDSITAKRVVKRAIRQHPATTPPTSQPG